MAERRSITLLGSTGSIGRQALEVVSCHPEELSVRALVFGSNLELAEEQARRFRPEVVVTGREELYKPLRRALKDTGIRVSAGREAVLEAAGSIDSDLVLSAIVGFAGLRPTLEAIRKGRTVVLANKESLVVGGDLIKQEAKAHAAVILPVDSEHSAIYQCIVGESYSEVAKIYLTASGGPFVDFTPEQLREVTPEQALRNPNWSMGAKVTVDSASMMNKGLEMIEAHHLFDKAPEEIEICVHRQSIVHSMVGFADGAVKAQLALPDMRLPIAYALLFPRRMKSLTPLPTVEQLCRLTFEPPRRDLFPCIDLAYRAIEEGGTSPCVLNAANEVAVRRFLDGEIRFTDIPALIARCLDTIPQRSALSVETLEGIDEEARRRAAEWKPTQLHA